MTGDAAGSHDFNALVSARLPIVVAFVLVLTLLLMLASFRSLRIALATIGLNLLSVAAAWGLLVLVFQHHWLDSLLGIRTNGAIVAWLPLFLFVILFGLSMDYHVFVLSRIREAHRGWRLGERRDRDRRRAHGGRRHERRRRDGRGVRHLRDALD